jgi:hypothetical protein
MNLILKYNSYTAGTLCKARNIVYFPRNNILANDDSFSYYLPNK